MAAEAATAHAAAAEAATAMTATAAHAASATKSSATPAAATAAASKRVAGDAGTADGQSGNQHHSLMQSEFLHQITFPLVPSARSMCMRTPASSRSRKLSAG